MTVVVTHLNKVMDIFSDILTKRRTQAQQDKGLDAQVEARPRWASEEGKPLKIRPVGKDDPRGRDYGRRDDPETRFSPHLMAPTDKGNVQDRNVPKKHITWDAIDRHQKREAMRRERLHNLYRNPHHRISPSPKDRLRRREADAEWEKHLRENPPPAHLDLSKKEITLRGRDARKWEQARGEKALYRRQGLNVRTEHGRTPEVKRGFSVRGYSKPPDTAPTTHTSPKPPTPQEKLAQRRKEAAQVEYDKSPEGQAELKRQRLREDLSVRGINYDLDAKGNPVGREPSAQIPFPGMGKPEPFEEGNDPHNQPHHVRAANREPQLSRRKKYGTSAGVMLMEKSRFEQQPNKGNFIPRPDPRKNTTSDNDDDTSVILAKESPRPVPGVSASHREKSVGRGKKAGGTFESDAAVPDNSTHVIGMEKADDAREAAKYQTRGKRKPSVMERRKPVISQPKDPNKPKQGKWEGGKWVQELVNFLKISSSTPDDERPGYLEGWADEDTKRRIKADETHPAMADVSDKDKQRSKFRTWQRLAAEKGELQGRFDTKKRVWPEALSEEGPPSVTNMKKAKDNIYAIATAAAKGDEDKKEEIVQALKRGKMILKLLKAAERRTKRQKKADQEKGLDARMGALGMPAQGEHFMTNPELVTQSDVDKIGYGAPKSLRIRPDARLATHIKRGVADLGEERKRKGLAAFRRGRAFRRQQERKSQDRHGEELPW